MQDRHQQEEAWPESLTLSVEPHSRNRTATRAVEVKASSTAATRTVARSKCAKAELVAVRVCELDVVGVAGKMGRTERDQSLRLAGGVGAD